MKLKSVRPKLADGGAWAYRLGHGDVTTATTEQREA
jgi:hypothetical protein